VTIPIGRTIYARVVNQTVTTPLELTWVDQNGNAVTLAQKDRINIVDLIVSNAATAKDVILFQDHDGDNVLDTGEEIIPPIEFSGQGTFGMGFGLDVPLRRINATGTNGLHIVASATGTISVLVVAHISRA